MKAVRFREFGGPEVLKYEDVPDVRPREDQVLVRVRACALNHLDLWVRKGLPGVQLPHINGSDIAGDVMEVGSYVSGVKRGTRVLLAPMKFCGSLQRQASISSSSTSVRRPSMKVCARCVLVGRW